MPVALPFLLNHLVEQNMLRVFLLMLALFLGPACNKTVFTGRKQLKLIPVSSINAESFLAYRTFLSENKPVNSGKNLEMVRRIGNDIKAAVEVYYKAHHREAALSNFDWEFNLVDDPNTVNAFCMPGGKVVFYTGILNVAKNEDAVACVMGHEIAHALANHGNERMSQGLLAQFGLVGLDVALAEKPAETRQLLLTAAGITTQLAVLLPFSRLHESEADEIGLYLMAMAGYDVREAAPFWERMSSLGGGRPPAFLSTHPDPSRRSERLKALLPKALEYAGKYPVPASSRNR
jgi:predicted Zn-dependent protease